MSEEQEAVVEEEVEAQEPQEDIPDPENTIDQPGEDESRDEEPDDKEAETESTQEKSTEEKPQPKKKEAEEKPSEEPKKHIVRIDDKDFEVSLDELVKGYQSHRSSSAKYQKAEEMMKGAKSVLELVADDPVRAAIQLNTGRFGNRERAEEHVYQIMAKAVLDRVQEESLPEAERDLKRRERALADRERELQEERKRIEYEQQVRTKEKFYQEIDAGVQAAIKDLKLPATKVVYDEIIQDLTRHSEDESYTPKEAAMQVQLAMREREKQLLDGLTPEVLLEKYPQMAESLAAMLQKQKSQAAVRSTKEGAMRPTQEASTSTKPTRRDGAKRFSWNELFDPDRRKRGR